MNRRLENHIPYFAPLDGVRGVAIVAVLLFHVRPAALRGGFTGVDVFFVLSGFLITLIVRRDLLHGTFSMREFYLRRVQRLLPNVVVLIFGVLVFWTFLMPSGSAGQAGRHGLWALGYSSNIYIWRNLGAYWGDAAEWAPFTHTWSLGIEEQFYLVFPSGLLLLLRFQRRRARAWLCIATAASFALCAWGTYAHPIVSFYLLPSRAWELLIGAVLAYNSALIDSNKARTESSWKANAVNFFGWLGLSLILMGFILIKDERGFPGFPCLVPVVGTALVLISVSAGNTGVAGPLSNPALVALGRMSYSLYLWHWPLIILGKTQADLFGLPQAFGAAVGCACGIALSWAAYAFVEQPLRRRGGNRRGRIILIAAGYMAAALACGVIAFRRPEVDLFHQFDPVKASGPAFDVGRPPSSESTFAVVYSDVHSPPRPSSNVDSWRTGGVLHLFGGGNPKVVVLGSSHATMYSPLIDDICRQMGLSVAFLGAVYGTPAFFESVENPNFSSPQEAVEFDETRRKWLAKWRPEAVFLADRWDGQELKGPHFDTRLRGFLREVAPLAGRVIFIAQVPALNVGEGVNLRGAVTWRMRAVEGLPRLMPDSNEPLRRKSVAEAEAALAEFPNLRVLRADLPFYREDGSVRYAAGRTFFYVDNNHLTDAGTEVVRDLFKEAIREAVGTSPSPEIRPK